MIPGPWALPTERVGPASLPLHEQGILCLRERSLGHRSIHLLLGMGMTEREHGPEDFERVATPYLPLLWRCARRLVHTGHEAEDLVQETCLKAFRAWQQFQAGTDARAWLVTILLNTARDWGRKTLRQPETLGLDALTTLARQDTSVLARTATPEHTAAQAEVGSLSSSRWTICHPNFG